MLACYSILFMDPLNVVYNKKVTIRIPENIHSALRILAFYSGKSMNQIFIESLSDGLYKWLDDHFSGNLFYKHGKEVGEYIETELSAEKLNHLKGKLEETRQIVFQIGRDHE